MPTLELTFLGSGTSAGVPMIGCHCAVCRSENTRDKRLRSSIVVSYPDGGNAEIQRTFLIDTSPDLRQQALREPEALSRLDGVLFTHAHADHIFGLDELRRFNTVMGRAIEIHAEADVLTSLHQTFPYIFERSKHPNDGYIANLIAFAREAGVPFDLCGATWTPIRLLHGRLPIVGYRVDMAGKSLAYCTDVSGIPPESHPLLQGLDLLVLDALRYRHHPTHFTVDQALAAVAEAAPKQALFTHFNHEIGHEELAARLPPGVAPAYDGLKVTL